jgi:SAM-dependent methyltransferase
MNIISVIRKHGPLGTARKIKGRFFARPARRFSDYMAARRARKLSQDMNLFDDLVGLEIGGPSPIFSANGLVPVYTFADRVDNTNFSSQTIWEGSIKAGDTFSIGRGKKVGKQYIAEATNLKDLPSNHYDFVLSSHMLEHSANPIKALREWMRVIKPNGLLLVVLPDKERTFDHRRPTTSISHMIEDYDVERGEDDLTHLHEILALHDISMTPEIPDQEFFLARSLKNIDNRCLHHHTFTLQSAGDLVRHVGLQILKQDKQPPHHLIFIARKT